MSGYKFNPFTGTFDIVGTGGSGPGSQNFSYKEVGPLEDILIPEGQQMLVDGEMRVLGHLTVRGQVVDISDRGPEQFFYDLIPEGDVVMVEANRLLMFNGSLTVRGHLRVNGRLVEV